MVRGKKSFVVAILLAAGMAMISASPASAYNYDGTDPEKTGCARSSYHPRYNVVKSSWGGYLGEIHLVHSYSCVTSWARVSYTTYNFPYGAASGLASGYAGAWVYRPTDGKWSSQCHMGSDPYTKNYCYTTQLNNSYNQSAKACGEWWDFTKGVGYAIYRCTSAF